ncbi:MAG: hypothetical protein IPI73_24655 [Betaproteobacteria bacterium]|nr:hypothetical protein [Betaproteobacteria bacterium]
MQAALVRHLCEVELEVLVNVLAADRAHTKPFHTHTSRGWNGEFLLNSSMVFTGSSGADQIASGTPHACDRLEVGNWIVVQGSSPARVLRMRGAADNQRIPVRPRLGDEITSIAPFAPGLSTMKFEVLRRSFNPFASRRAIMSVELPTANGE